MDIRQSTRFLNALRHNSLKTFHKRETRQVLSSSGFIWNCVDGVLFLENLSLNRSNFDMGLVSATFRMSFWGVRIKDPWKECSVNQPATELVINSNYKGLSHLPQNLLAVYHLHFAVYASALLIFALRKPDFFPNLALNQILNCFHSQIV